METCLQQCRGAKRRSTDTHCSTPLCFTLLLTTLLYTHHHHLATLLRPALPYPLTFRRRPLLPCADPTPPPALSTTKSLVLLHARSPTLYLPLPNRPRRPSSPLIRYRCPAAAQASPIVQLSKSLISLQNREYICAQTTRSYTDTLCCMPSTLATQ